MVKIDVDYESTSLLQPYPNLTQPLSLELRSLSPMAIGKFGSSKTL